MAKAALDKTARLQLNSQLKAEKLNLWPADVAYATPCAGRIMNNPKAFRKKEVTT